MRYATLKEVQEGDGLRLVIVQGLPSPWSQAAKTIFEVKGLDYVVAPYVPFGANEEIARWGGENSAPIVAWKNEKPIHRWIDILHLAERLAPKPALIPAEPADRVLMFGLSNELCGELGLGWNRRLQLVAPAMESGNAPPDVARLSGKYGYNAADLKAASERIAGTLEVLGMQLEAQYGRGVEFFVGDALSALDIYWVAFANLIDPLPKESCAMPEDWRPAMTASDPSVKKATTALLLQHRDRIFRKYFRDPMEF